MLMARSLAAVEAVAVATALMLIDPPPWRRAEPHFYPSLRRRRGARFRDRSRSSFQFYPDGVPVFQRVGRLDDDRLPAREAFLDHHLVLPLGAQGHHPRHRLALAEEE